MKIPKERLAQIDASAPTFGYNIKRVSLSAKSRRMSRDIKRQIEEHHQGAFIVFEEAVRFIVAFEDFQFSRKDISPEATPFRFMLARVRADLISIRSLLLAGQESSALAIARVFMEDIELTMATAVDTEFAIAFMDTDDPDKFWSTRIAYGKIYPCVERFLHLGGQKQSISAAYIKQHRTMKSFLSRHVHPSFSSAFNLVAPAALEAPGMFAFRPAAWFGENSGRLCLYIAEETQAFSATCINAFIKPNPPPALAGYEPSKSLAKFMRPAHNLQTLLQKYSSRMHSTYGRKSKAWEEEADLESET